MATALERIQLSEQPAFIDRVEAVVIDVARMIQLEETPSTRRLDLSYQALRHGAGLGQVFAKVVAGFPAPHPNGTEVSYDSDDAHIKTAVMEVWDFVAGVKLPQ